MQDRFLAVCACGQDLDVVKGGHCTRCGVSLDRLARTTGSWWGA